MLLTLQGIADLFTGGSPVDEVHEALKLLRLVLGGFRPSLVDADG